MPVSPFRSALLPLPPNSAGPRAFPRPALSAAAPFALALGLLLAPAATPAQAQPKPPAVPDFLASLDPNKDSQVSREELQKALQSWLGTKSSLSQEELVGAINQALPEGLFMGMISPPQNRTPKADDVAKMMAALPDSPAAKPRKPRKILVLNKCAGFVHSSIPLAAKTIEELGNKTQAWTTTIQYEADGITAENLKQYDLIFLNNTTGHFLDDPDPAVTAARKKALLEFVRSGKGLAGIHAASDSYHQANNGPMVGSMLGAGMFAALDKNQDKQADSSEFSALANDWFDKASAGAQGPLTLSAFRAAFPRLLFSLRAPRGPRGQAGPPAARQGMDPQVGTWPEFNRLIGGYFKYHWNDPQPITYKIDDPRSPINAPFRDGFQINDETYTFGMRSWSRDNLRVLTSVDYDKMTPEDKRKEDYPRTDQDYGLSWIRREGKGRVFYTAHGHSERVYANAKFLAHLLAGVQYALGDLKADDKPSVAKAK